MLQKHFPGVRHHDRDESGEKLDVSHPSFGCKLGHVWMNHAFPEALADISITKNATKTDFVVRKDIHGINLFPEIEKEAEVRRGLDLAQEEIAFLAKRRFTYGATSLITSA
jgi:hypothetical protein